GPGFDPGPWLTIHTGRLASASVQLVGGVALAHTDSGGRMLLLKEFTVTATSGTVRLPSLRTAIVMVARLASAWLEGNEDLTMLTGKVPDGSLASWRVPPQAPRTRGSVSVSAIPARTFKALLPVT